MSGRLGLGNLVPGSGLLTKKTDHTRDVVELLGPVGDIAKRGFEASGQAVPELQHPISLVAKAYGLK